MLDTLQRLAARLGYAHHRPAHRLNRHREIPEHRLLRLKLPNTPAPEWPYNLTRHSLDERIDGEITPATWYGDGGDDEPGEASPAR